MTGDLVATAERLAEDVLFANALALERGDVPLRDNLDELARHGFYGAAVPVELGGSGVDFADACSATELLASGCLCTTVVIGQHLGITSMVAGGDARMREDWVPDLAAGSIRCGAVFTGAIPGPPQLTVRETPTGYRLDGSAPWVSGWGEVDVLGVAARDAEDNIAWLLVDAAESPTLRVRRQQLVAADASNTVLVEFDGHPVPAERLVAVTTHGQQAASEPVTKRLNGALVLGVARRCVQLLDEPEWSAELDARRTALDAALDPGSGAGMDEARGRAAEFAVRAAAATVVRAGSRSVLVDRHPQRLSREAALLLVFASRPGIRDVLQRDLRP